MTGRPCIVAIDGPSGAGKGTIARAIASELGFRYVDSGAMYRVVAWKAQQTRVAFDDEPALVRLADTSCIDVVGATVTVDGVDVSRLIRTPEVDRAAAAVARVPGVRAVLVARQREIGAEGGVVMEGRDIGTVVFPRADVKVYLDASAEERAARRAQERAHASAASVADVASELIARDESDRTRQASPLYAAPDAHVIDTTDMPVATVVHEVLHLVRSVIASRG
jgi:cytidylate kinase